MEGDEALFEINDPEITNTHFYEEWLDDMKSYSYFYIRLLNSTIEAPVLTSPTLATSDDGNLPSLDENFTITWNAIKNAVSYRVRIYEYYDDEYNEILLKRVLQKLTLKFLLTSYFMADNSN